MGAPGGKRDIEASESGRKNGEFDFAAQLEASHRLLVVIAAGYTGQPGTAEDIVHDAAATALGKIDQFEPGTNFTAWMAQFVRYAASNYVRAERRRRTITLTPEELEKASGPSPGNNIELHLTESGQMPDDQTAFDDELMEALGALSDVARACLLLRTLEGLSYGEIAEVLQIPQGTAMSHVYRSRHDLRRRLGDRVTGPGRRERGTS